MDSSFAKVIGVLTIFTPFLMIHCQQIDARLDREKRLDEMYSELNSLRDDICSMIDDIEANIDYIQSNSEEEIEFDYDLSGWRDDVSSRFEEIIEKCSYPEIEYDD